MATVTPGPAADAEWGGLAELSAEERQARIVERYREMASLPEEERLSRMLAMVRAEYALDDAHLRAFTESRLKAWLLLEPETARAIAGTYDAAMLKMPGPQAMRRVAMVQTLARDLHEDDRQRLVALVPGVFAGARFEIPAALRGDRPLAEKPLATVHATRSRKGLLSFFRR